MRVEDLTNPLKNSRILTVPNQLTFLRLGFLPFFIIALYSDRYDWALGILIAAGISDGLDGLLARGLESENSAGRLSGSDRGQASDVLVVFRARAEGKNRLVADDSGAGPRRDFADRERRDSGYGGLPPVSAEHLGKNYYDAWRFCWFFW